MLLHLRECADVEMISRRLLDFLTELYAFMAVSSYLTPGSIPKLHRYIPIDSILSSLSSLNRGSPIYGAMFGSAHALFEMIPSIATSAKAMQVETEVARQTRIEHYENELRSWKCCDSELHSNKAGLDDRFSQPDDSYRIGGEIYREVLFIFLYSSFNGSRKPSEELYAKIDPHLDNVLELLLSIPKRSSILTTMMWPGIVAGSCMRFPHQQQSLKQLYSLSAIKMFSVTRSVELLEFLWCDQVNDPRIYGLHGLEVVMANRDLNVCVG